MVETVLNAKMMLTNTVSEMNGSTDFDSLYRGRLNMYKSKVNVVLGAQWDDEGKGKVVDMLASGVDIVCRCQVSASFLRSFKKYNTFLQNLRFFNWA